MAIRLPRPRREIPVVEETKGPTLAFQQWIDIAFKQIEKSVGDIQVALSASGIALDGVGGGGGSLIMDGGNASGSDGSLIIDGGDA